MRVQIEDNKLVITTEQKIIHFDLYKNVDNNMKHEIDSIINHNENLTEHTIKNEIKQFLSKYKHANGIFEHGKQ